MLDLQQIAAAIDMIAKEKKIPKDKIVEIIEAALKTAYKKDYGDKDENVNVTLNFEENIVEISLEKTVVKEVEEPATEISFEQLREEFGDDADGFEEGDVVEIDLTDELMNEENKDTFGRIASQAARQVIIQKIGDSEKERIYELFVGKEGEVANMKVEMVESGKVILDYNGNQVVLPKSEQVPRDSYIPDARFYVYVAEVSNPEGGNPKVVLSRKRAELVSAIFAQQVPEIDEGVVNIDYIVRQAGVKTKILVSTNYDEIDPVGTLIGQKWVRVKAVMEEISGEKIDIIANNGDLEGIIKKSLTPAEIVKVSVDADAETADVYLLPSERARALGRNGVNINLASQLTGFKISVHELEEEKKEEEVVVEESTEEK